MPFLSPARAIAPPVILRRRRRSMAGMGIMLPYQNGNDFPYYWRRGVPRIPTTPMPLLPEPGSPNPPVPTVYSGSPAIAVVGTPVPAGFPVNQLFMAPDGSQWAYSTTQARWMNVGVPFNLNPPSAPAPASTSIPTSSGPPGVTPASVTVAPAAASSPYSAVLNWLTQNSLVSALPNWGTLAIGYGLLEVFRGMSKAKAGR
jgi:hypothetical protein